MQQSKVKVTIIGGGSSYTPELIEGIIQHHQEFPVTEIALVDIEEGQQKLDVIYALAQRMIRKAKLSIQVTATTDRQQGVKDASFVCAQIRVGGLDARAKDELIPLKYHRIGQETTGAGGFAKGLRTIPVMLDICRDIEEFAPNATLINFTNPAGMVTEAILKHTNVPVIGLCNLPIGTKMQVAKVKDVPVSMVDIEVIGINHLNWTRNIQINGRDVTASVIDEIAKSGGLSVKNVPNMDLGENFLQELGMLPCSYLNYFYLQEGMLEEQIKATKKEGTRALIVKDIEASLFELYQDEHLEEKPKELEKRGGAYYSEAAIHLMTSIYTNKQDLQIVNVRNNHTIPFLDEDAVIETKCVIGKEGATPVSISRDIPPTIKGLIQVVKNYETLTIEAAINGDYHLALHALAPHPLVGSVTTAKNILDDILVENEIYLDRFS